MSADAVESSESKTAKAGGLASPSYLGLLATQFLGALNDNMFRWLVVPIAKPELGAPEALSLGLALFTVPYLLLASTAGYLADKLSKRRVIVACKIAEIVIMALGVAAIAMGNLVLLLAVVGLMGCQSALFGPAKFGSIPELVGRNRISKANGYMALISVVASALGFIAGTTLYDATKPDIKSPVGLGEMSLIPAGLIGIAFAGWLTSLLIRAVPAPDPQRKFPVNPFAETWASLRRLDENRPLMRAAWGIGFFWLLASLAQMNIDVFGIEVLKLPQKDIGLLLGILVVGLGAGSVLAGYWSSGRVELGIVPLGALGIVISGILLYLSGSRVDPTSLESLQSAYVWSCAWLFLLGLAAGLFNIPLEAFLQHRSDRKHRGMILAASNFIAFSLILFSSGLFYVLKKQLELTASHIFLIAAIGTVPVLAYVVFLLPGATLRFIVWLLANTIYRLRIYGKDENLPETGGALLVANHVSWIDGILLMLTSSRPIRMLAYADYVKDWRIRHLAKLYGAIPIKDSAGPKELLKSLQTAREAIENGELVCIFAEGEITRTGQLQSFNRGLLHIVKGTDAPVVPVYLDGLWGSVFSHRGGKLFWKRPRQWPYPVAVSFGHPIEKPNDVNHVRSAVQNLGVESVTRRMDDETLPARRFLRMCKQNRRRVKIADTSGTEITGSKLLTAVLAFKRVLERNGIGRNEEMVGVFVPPSNGGVIVNAALTLMRKVPVNLNYTLSEDVVGHCIRECKIKHVLTSRRFLDKRPFNLDAEVITLEDLKEQITGLEKAFAFLDAILTPVALLERRFRLKTVKPDDLMTVIFTSGSTGEPKGVMLTHANVLSNINAIDESYQLTSEDVLLAKLPFFHSFGFTANLWLALTLSPKVVFHMNPLDSKTVGKLCQKHNVTILMSTPTFLRAYLKRCTKEQFHALDTVVTGAEKLPADVYDAFLEKFGVEISEGYGTTELSPVAAVNIPQHRTGAAEQISSKRGTIGRPIPGVAAKVVDPDSGEDLGLNKEGLMWIKGPNVMKGYLNQPEKTAEVIHDGWYDTGDVAKIDDDGFVQITGRLSRFSKIGGEMVPHIRIEETLNRILEDPEDDTTETRAAVTSVPHPKKGERIVVLHTPFSKPMDEVLRELSEAGLPNLWIPSRDGFIEVEEIPILGTGKLDLNAVKETALQRCDADVADR